jgi:hypothetical protein
VVVALWLWGGCRGCGVALWLWRCGCGVVVVVVGWGGGCHGACCGGSGISGDGGDNLVAVNILFAPKHVQRQQTITIEIRKGCMQFFCHRM